MFGSRIVGETGSWFSLSIRGSRRKRRRQVRTLERELGVELPGDVRWAAETFGTIQTSGVPIALFVSERETYGYLTLECRERDALPSHFVAFSNDDEVVGGHVVVDTLTGSAHTWNSYECDGLGRSLGQFLEFLAGEMEYHLGLGSDPIAGLSSDQ